MIITAHHVSDTTGVELRSCGAGWLPPLWFETAAIQSAQERFGRDRLIINILNKEGDTLQVLNFPKRSSSVQIAEGSGTATA